jgi:hypothetical protein
MKRTSSINHSSIKSDGLDLVDNNVIKGKTKD